MKDKNKIKLFICMLILISTFFIPHPEGVSENGWHLLGIFVGVIAMVVFDALPMAPATILGLTTCLLTKTLTFTQAFTGFQNKVVWLIFMAFFIATGFINTGLGKRMSLYIIKMLGKNTLGLGYGIALADLVLAPAIPSVTARSGGVIFPIAQSLARVFGSKGNHESSNKIGNYLISVSFQVTAITGSLFMTAMAANPMMVELAKDQGIHIDFYTWFSYAIVPGITSLIFTPWLVYKISSPKIKKTPEAISMANESLSKMGTISSSELKMLFIFILLLVLWSFGSKIGISATLAALVGFSLLVLLDVVNWGDLLKVKGAFDTFIWFGALLSIATNLNNLGVSSWIGENAAKLLIGYKWQTALMLLILIYFYIHYLFASMAAHIGALYTPFLLAAISLGAPPIITALIIAFASNLIAGLTHYSSGPAPILYGSGYVSLKKWWLIGGLCSISNIIIWSIVGSLWWSFIQ